MVILCAAGQQGNHTETTADDAFSRAWTEGYQQFLRNIVPPENSRERNVSRGHQRSTRAPIFLKSDEMGVNSLDYICAKRLTPNLSDFIKMGGLVDLLIFNLYLQRKCGTNFFCTNV